MGPHDVGGITTGLDQEESMSWYVNEFIPTGGTWEGRDVPFKQSGLGNEMRVTY